ERRIWCRCCRTRAADVHAKSNNAALSLHRCELQLEINLHRYRRKESGHSQHVVRVNFGQDCELRIKDENARKIEMLFPKRSKNLSQFLRRIILLESGRAQR